MAMLMKELDAFSRKDLRTVERVVRLLNANNYTVDDLAKFNESAPKVNNQPKQKRKPTKPAKPPGFILAPGESEIVSLFCGCGSEMVVEALCSVQAVKKECIRIANCTLCGNEVKIR